MESQAGTGWHARLAVQPEGGGRDSVLTAGPSAELWIQRQQPAHTHTHSPVRRVAANSAGIAACHIQTRAFVQMYNYGVQVCDI